MPTQIPRTGCPRAIRPRMTPAPPTAAIPAIHAAKAPTPGTTSPSAAPPAAGSALTVTAAPIRASARCALRRFPDP